MKALELPLLKPFPPAYIYCAFKLFLFSYSPVVYRRITVDYHLIILLSKHSNYHSSCESASVGYFRQFNVSLSVDPIGLPFNEKCRVMRRARFAGRDITWYIEHQTVLPESDKASDRCGLTYDWVPETRLVF